MSREVRDLTAAERAYAAGRPEEATRRVERLLGEIARTGPDSDPERSPTS